MALVSQPMWTSENVSMKQKNIETLKMLSTRYVVEKVD